MSDLLSETSPVKNSPPDDFPHQLWRSESGQVGGGETGGAEEFRHGGGGGVAVLRHQPVDPGHQSQGVGQPGEVRQLGGPAVGGSDHVERPR